MPSVSRPWRSPTVTAVVVGLALVWAGALQWGVVRTRAVQESVAAAEYTLARADDHLSRADSMRGAFRELANATATPLPGRTGHGTVEQILREVLGESHPMVFTPGADTVRAGYVMGLTGVAQVRGSWTFAVHVLSRLRRLSPIVVVSWSVTADSLRPMVDDSLTVSLEVVTWFRSGAIAGVARAP